MMPNDLPVIRGPFESMDHCLDFKSAIEGEDPDRSVACARDPEGKVFARVTKKASAAAPPSVNPDIPATPPAPNMDQPGPLPDVPIGRFVSARKIGPKAVIYVDEHGRDVIREGGSVAWRNRNAGNISRGPFSETAGSIGDDGTFAMFPSEAIGFDAIIALLRTATYRELTIEKAIFRYAPPSENDSPAYVAFVTTETGLSRDSVLKTLPAAELRRIATAIRKMEGFKPGIERLNSPAAEGAPAAATVGKGTTAIAAVAQDWMRLAEEAAALPERERSAWPDPGENPRILNYFRVAASWFEAGEGDETDWCAAFVNFCLISSGHLGTEHPGARSFFWNRKGQFVKLAGPVRGAVAVQRHAPFDDLEWKTGKGHVGFVTSFTATTVTLLGGNQRATIRAMTFPRETRDAAGKVTSRFVAFMMPATS